MRSLLAIALCAAAATTAPQGMIELHSKNGVISNTKRDSAAVRVLFIGNSLTYWNEMPWMLERIASSLPGPRIQTAFSGMGGATLRQHWLRGRAQRAIAEGSWHYVVIQPQSSELVRSPDETRTYATKFSELARQHGATPLLFVTWPPPGAPFTQADLDKRYTELATDIDAPLVPVARIFEALRKRGFEPLDGSVHPSLVGSYASACAFYAAVTGRSPLKAVHRFDVKFDIAEISRRALESEQIPDDAAEIAQRAASISVRSRPAAAPAH